MPEDLNLQDILDSIGPQILSWAANLLGALLLLLVAWPVAGWIRRGVLRSLSKARVDVTLARFASKAARWVVLLVAVISALGLFGVNVTTFAAVIAALGLAIGLAFPPNHRHRVGREPVDTRLRRLAGERGGDRRDR